MLRQCPYFKRCTFVDRMLSGNKEYHCMGITSYDNCSRFPELELMESQKIIEPYLLLNQNLRRIYKGIRFLYPKSLFMAICDAEGKILHCDSGMEDHDFIIRTSKEHFDDMKQGDSLIRSNITTNDFLFFKVSNEGMLALFMPEGFKEELPDIKRCLDDNLIDFSSSLRRYVIWESFSNPLKGPSDFSFFEKFQDLEALVQRAGTVDELLTEIDLMHSLVNQIFAWHPLMYELMIIHKKFQKYKKGKVLSNAEKKELLNRIDEWKNFLF